MNKAKKEEGAQGMLMKAFGFCFVRHQKPTENSEQKSVLLCLRFSLVHMDQC